MWLITIISEQRDVDAVEQCDVNDSNHDNDVTRLHIRPS